MPTDENRRSIIVVDDEDALRKAVCATLRKAGYEVVGCARGSDALSKASQKKFDAAVLDLRMPGMSGLRLVHELHEVCPDTIVIILSAVPDLYGRLAEQFKTSGVYAFLHKPCTLQMLRDTIEQAFDEQERDLERVATLEDVDP